MGNENTPGSLDLFFSRYKGDVSAEALRGRKSDGAVERPDPLRMIYEDAVGLVERGAAEHGFKGGDLELQRGLYREFEQLISPEYNDLRHSFIIVIPVADRPVMLKDCLSSLAEQCSIFQYGLASPEGGGRQASEKISVFIIDDSKDPSNISRIKAIAAETAAAGLHVHYVGQAEQSGIVNKVPADLKKELSGLIGDFEGDSQGHKGASVTRNIAYLHLCQRLSEFPANTLIWFIDSDEEFRINTARRGRTAEIHFINYFYWLDRIFGSSDVEVLTGKVVGDPPVTPSVMIDTFLDDILQFLEETSGARPDLRCIFHEEPSAGAFSAEYHDMVGLFGYKRPTAARRYLCGLKGDHSVRDCFEDFSGRATGFFHGLHPTRTQFYSHRGDFMATEKARTVYTGNYIVSPKGLRHFIPFAGLGLRMAGPTLGRILRARLKERFVSANLPLLHKRTGPGRLTDGFRKGVVKKGSSLDLSDEFHRQFWGDVMLFSVEALCQKGFPEERRFEAEEIKDTVMKIQDRIWAIYSDHSITVSEKIEKIRGLLASPRNWWRSGPDGEAPLRNFEVFCKLAEENFGKGSGTIKTISAETAGGDFTGKIIRAISSFYEEDILWRGLLESLQNKG